MQRDLLEVASRSVKDTCPATGTGNQASGWRVGEWLKPNAHGNRGRGDACTVTRLPVESSNLSALLELMKENQMKTTEIHPRQVAQTTCGPAVIVHTSHHCRVTVWLGQQVEITEGNRFYVKLFALTNSPPPTDADWDHYCCRSTGRRRRMTPPDDGSWECLEVLNAEDQPYLRGYFKIIK